MHTTETILGLLTAVAALAWLANRLRVPYPIFLVIGGLALSFVPHLPQIELDPEHVFLLLLPPILYYGGTHTSWRDFKANLRPILLLAVGLVLFCTGAIGLAAHQLIGLGWASSLALGAIASPTDAVAATSILQRLHVPRRVVVILEGESLVNDATALVLYQFAVHAATVGSFSASQAVVKFLVAGGGGVIFGLLIGMAAVWVRPRLRDGAVENVVSLLTPYLAYLPADRLGLSGVLAVVTCGIYISRRLGRITTAQVRLRTYAIWDAVIFLLNGVIFILIGLQISRIAKGTTPMWVWHTIAITFIAIIARMLWVLPATYVPRWTIPFVGRNDPEPLFRNVFLIAWTQMRGVVSLAAALALPLTMPGRDVILFVTFGVILITLVGQGLTLPALIRSLKVEADLDETQDEEVTARYLAALAAIERLDSLGANSGDAAAMLQRLRATYDDRLGYYSQLMHTDGTQTDLLSCDTGEQAVHQAIAAQRDMLLRLRDQGTIGDDVLRLIEQELDHEESTLGEGTL